MRTDYFNGGGSVTKDKQIICGGFVNIISISTEVH